MATVLSVNLNKIALIRNSRGRNDPDVCVFARMALNNGAGGVTIHPRPDQRHARYSDAHELKALLADYPGKELNIEGNPVDEFLDVVLEVKPEQCTLVPDDPNQITSDHGYDLTKDGEMLKPIVERLQAAGIRVSIFMDPVPEQMALASQLGVERVELYTEGWAQAFGSETQEAVLESYRASAAAAREVGLEVNAGHDLDLQNLATFLTIPGVDEVSIGHALTVEALHQGYESVVRQYATICEMTVSE